MAEMGGYCKAYPIERFRAFSEWKEDLTKLRIEKQKVGRNEVEVQRSLRENDFFYLQENFTVTDGVFIDENIIFDSVTPEWIEYCKNILNFEVPAYQQRQAEQS